MAASHSVSGKAAPAAARGYELVITREFDAPRELVFEAWIRPEHLAHWSAPEGFTFPFHESDVRAGGSYRCCMRAPDGTEHWLHGTYQQIEPPSLLVFTHAWEGADGEPVDPTLVTVRFTAVGKRTRMDFHQAFFAAEASRDGHAEGWRSCFALLDAWLAKRKESGAGRTAQTMDDSFYVTLATPRIETRAFLFAGLSRRHPHSEAAFDSMTAQWRDAGPLLDDVPQRAAGSAAVFFRMYGDFDSFDMVAGVEVNGRGHLPDGMIYEEIAPCRYAVFAHDGHVSKLRNTVWTIWERWLPQSSHRPASAGGPAPDFIEIYGADFDPATGHGPIEVWVPLA